MFEKEAEGMNKQDFCKRMRMSDIDFAIKKNGDFEIEDMERAYLFGRIDESTGKSCSNCILKNKACPKSCVNYNEWKGFKNPQLEYAKTIIQDLLDNSDEYARQRAMDFLEEEK